MTDHVTLETNDLKEAARLLTEAAINSVHTRRVHMPAATVSFEETFSSFQANIGLNPKGFNGIGITRYVTIETARDKNCMAYTLKLIALDMQQKGVDAVQCAGLLLDGFKMEDGKV